MIGPALFAIIVVVLTVAQYGFMVDLGWDPIGTSAAFLPLVVVAAKERPTLARLRSVHHHHRSPLRGVDLSFGIAVGVLPLPCRGAGVGRGDGNPAALRR